MARGGLKALMAACTLPIAAAAAIPWLACARNTRARLLSFPVALLYVLVDADDISARGQAFGDLGVAVLVVGVIVVLSGVALVLLDSARRASGPPTPPSSTPRRD